MAVVILLPVGGLTVLVVVVLCAVGADHGVGRGVLAERPVRRRVRVRRLLRPAGDGVAVDVLGRGGVRVVAPPGVVGGLAVFLVGDGELVVVALAVGDVLVGEVVAVVALVMRRLCVEVRRRGGAPAGRGAAVVLFPLAQAEAEQQVELEAHSAVLLVRGVSHYRQERRSCVLLLSGQCAVGRWGIYTSAECSA